MIQVTTQYNKHRNLQLAWQRSAETSSDQHTHGTIALCIEEADTGRCLQTLPYDGMMGWLTVEMTPSRACTRSGAFHTVGHHRHAPRKDACTDHHHVLDQHVTGRWCFHDSTHHPRARRQWREEAKQKAEKEKGRHCCVARRCVRTSSSCVPVCTQIPTEITQGWSLNPPPQVKAPHLHWPRCGGCISLLLPRCAHPPTRRSAADAPQKTNALGPRQPPQPPSPSPQPPPLHGRRTVWV